MWKSERIVGLAIVVLVSAGCGPELLGGAENAEVRTVATGEDTQSSNTRAASGDGPAESAIPADPAFQTSADAEGEVSFDMAAWLVDEDGDTLMVTDGFVTGAVRIEGGDEVLLGRVDVPAGRYVAARVIFTRVHAVVEGGLLVGGTPVIGLVRVDLGATSRVAVDRPLDVQLEGRTTNTLVVELNARRWLDDTVLPGAFVPGSELAAAVEIGFR